MTDLQDAMKKLGQNPPPHLAEQFGGKNPLTLLNDLMDSEVGEAMQEEQEQSKEFREEVLRRLTVLKGGVGDLYALCSRIEQKLNLISGHVVEQH